MLDKLNSKKSAFLNSLAQQAVLYKTLYGVTYNLYTDSPTADRDVSFSF